MRNGVACLLLRATLFCIVAQRACSHALGGDWQASLLLWRRPTAEQIVASLIEYSATLGASARRAAASAAAAT